MIKQFAKLGLVLAAFAVCACVGLSLVYAATKDQIASNASKRLNESLKDIFSEADEFTSERLDSPDPAILFSEVYVAKRGGTPIGIAVKASGASYGGPSVLLVGMGMDRRIAGVRVLENKDTPGLGANAASPTYYVNKESKTTFPGQFTGKALSEAFEVKKDIAAISASTITSKALTKIIKAAGDGAASWIDRAAGGK